MANNSREKKNTAFPDRARYFLYQYSVEKVCSILYRYCKPHWFGSGVGESQMKLIGDSKLECLRVSEYRKNSYMQYSYK